MGANGRNSTKSPGAVWHPARPSPGLFGDKIWFCFFPKPQPCVPPNSGWDPLSYSFAAWSCPLGQGCGGTGVAWVGAVLLIGVLVSEGMVVKGPQEVLPMPRSELRWCHLAQSRSPHMLPPSAAPTPTGLPRASLRLSSGGALPSHMESSVLLLTLEKSQNAHVSLGSILHVALAKMEPSSSSGSVSAAQVGLVRGSIILKGTENRAASSGTALGMCNLFSKGWVLGLKIHCHHLETLNHF